MSVVGTENTLVRGSVEGVVTIPLPPGRYAASWQGREVTRLQRFVDLPAPPDPLDLGLLPLVPSTLSATYGNSLPYVEWVAESGRTRVDAPSWRGKWTVLEFFSVTCGPCLRRAIPALVEFDLEFTDVKEVFTIILVHDKSLKSHDALSHEIERVAEQLWGGRRPPFPLRLDASGELMRTLGVDSLPSMVLLDPSGRVVPRGSLDDVARACLAARPTVRALVERLPEVLSSPVEAFVPWLEEAVSLGGRSGAYVCTLAGERVSDAARRAITFGGLRRMGTATVESLRFLTGSQGMRSPDAATRIEAARVFEVTADPRWSIFVEGLAFAEPDSTEVRAVLDDVLARMRARVNSSVAK